MLGRIYAPITQLFGRFYSFFAESNIKPWKKGPKPKALTKNVFYCKRRKPQIETDTPKFYRDPHKKEITQITTACNDGFISGHCPFTILLNLNNEDVKLIPDEWLARPPKICYGSDSDGKPTVELKTRSFGDMIAEYIAKYGTKGAQKRGDQGY